MSIVTSHTPVHPSIADESPRLPQNGIIQNPVASKKNYLFFKRAFDILFSFLFITLVMSWLVPLLALLVRIDSPGPIIFRQRRTGFRGKPFICYKLRTMRHVGRVDEVPATINDARITRVGRFLRRTNLDELPQFFNVLRGDMSIVGPRPHMAADCIRFSFVVPTYHFRNLVRPGITGYAQVKGFHGVTRDYESILQRFYWDERYVRKMSLWLDLRIGLLTMARAFGNMIRAIMSKHFYIY